MSTTQSLYYTQPFIFLFKNPAILEPNYLIFNNIIKPNSESCILAMATVNDNNTLEPFFSPNILVPFINGLTFGKTLEFIINDSKRQQVALKDSSQLYVLITVY